MNIAYSLGRKKYSFHLMNKLGILFKLMLENIFIQELTTILKEIE